MTWKTRERMLEEIEDRIRERRRNANRQKGQPMTTLYIVGKVLPDEDVNAWEFMGVFDSAEKADAACTTANHFYGPTILNRDVGDEQVVWPDVVYPRVEETK